MLITNSNPAPWSSFWPPPMAYFCLPFHSENSGSQNINSFTYLFIRTVHIKLFRNHHNHTPMQSRPKKSTIFVGRGRFSLLVTYSQRQCSKVTFLCLQRGECIHLKYGRIHLFLFGFSSKVVFKILFT